MNGLAIDCSTVLYAISFIASEACKDNLKLKISAEDIQNAIFHKEKDGKKSRVTSWTNPIIFDNITISVANHIHGLQLNVTKVNPSTILTNFKGDPTINHTRCHILKFSHSSLKHNCMRITDIISSGSIDYFKCSPFDQNCKLDVQIEASGKGFQIYKIFVKELKPRLLRKDTLRKVSKSGRPEDLKG